MGRDTLKIEEIIGKIDEVPFVNDKDNDKDTTINSAEDTKKVEQKKSSSKKDEGKKKEQPEVGTNTELLTVCNLLKSFEREVLENNRRMDSRFNASMELQKNTANTVKELTDKVKELEGKVETKLDSFNNDIKKHNPRGCCQG